MKDDVLELSMLPLPRNIIIHKMANGNQKAWRRKIKYATIALTQIPVRNWRRNYYYPARMLMFSSIMMISIWVLCTCRGVMTAVIIVCQVYRMLLPQD